jgi:hypothetical protein
MAKKSVLSPISGFPSPIHGIKVSNRLGFKLSWSSRDAGRYLRYRAIEE